MPSGSAGSAAALSLLSHNRLLIGKKSVFPYLIYSLGSRPLVPQTHTQPQHRALTASTATQTEPLLLPINVADCICEDVVLALSSALLLSSPAGVLGRPRPRLHRLSSIEHRDPDLFGCCWRAGRKKPPRSSPCPTIFSRPRNYHKPPWRKIEDFARLIGHMR